MFSTWCTKRKCFGNIYEQCCILTDTFFTRACPFFKTREEKIADEIAVMEHLSKKKWNGDLNEYYGGEEQFYKKLYKLQSELENLKALEKKEEE